jgi:hypothetical protein
LDTITSLQGQAIAPPIWCETGDLRKRPYNKDPAFQYPYCHPAPPCKLTSGLNVGTQAKLIAAALRAYEVNRPINTLLTIRWEGLLSYDDTNPLRAMKTPARIRYIVELVRKWLIYRRHPRHYIWARELSVVVGEHWHLAFYLPKAERAVFTQYIAGILGEPVAPCPRSASKRTHGEFACSDWVSWHLAGEVPDGKPHFTGYWLAAYLGKGEPSQRMFRDSLVNNTRKNVRGRYYGGEVKGGRYDEPQGNIEGTTTRKGRFDIARSLK